MDYKSFAYSMKCTDVMKFTPISVVLAFLALVVLSSCSPGEPYFSGANQFKVETLAPEGIKVVGTLWYHNTTREKGDHMSENLYVFMDGHERLPVNYGRDHVITVGPNARYDVPVVFYVPMDYVTKDVEEATLVSNKKKNLTFEFDIKGNGTILIGSDRHDMEVNHHDKVTVWPDL